MLSSMFRCSMPLLLWNWSACRKELWLYDSLQLLWKWFNLVYAQCNISAGIVQNPPQTRLSSSLDAGLSWPSATVLINCCQSFYMQLPPLSRAYSLLMLLVEKPNFYFIQVFYAMAIKVFLPQVESLLKNADSSYCFVFCHFNDCSCIYSPMIDFISHHGVFPSSLNSLNPPIKAIHCYIGLIIILYARWRDFGDGPWFNFFLNIGCGLLIGMNCGR